LSIEYIGRKNEEVGSSLFELNKNSGGKGFCITFKGKSVGEHINREGAYLLLSKLQLALSSASFKEKFSR